MPRNRKTLKSWASGPTRREITRRAASDLEQGLEDTDCRGQPARRARPEPPRPSRRKR